jgi:hypothetical protein
MFVAHDGYSLSCSILQPHHAPDSLCETNGGPATRRSRGGAGTSCGVHARDRGTVAQTETAGRKSATTVPHGFGQIENEKGKGHAVRGKIDTVHTV